MKAAKTSQHLLSLKFLGHAFQTRIFMSALATFDWTEGRNAINRTFYYRSLSGSSSGIFTND